MLRDKSEKRILSQNEIDDRKNYGVHSYHKIVEDGQDYDYDAVPGSKGYQYYRDSKVKCDGDCGLQIFGTYDHMPNSS